ncbi:hypothetical protein RI367_004722 [Sorochytrium milnesiophthora]
MAEATGNAAFIQASKDSETLVSQLSNDQLLELYALFKQGTVGDCNTSRPGMLDLKGKAKWDAWNAKKGMSQTEAQQKYIDYVASIKQ